MGIQLLGPVELRSERGTLTQLAGAQRRAVLALLALQVGRVVPVERFFELLWGDQPPAQARAALQGHVAALRKVLAETSFTLLTRSPGYLLIGDVEQVDVRRFELLAARAEGGADDAEAIGLLEQALGLWAGAALANLPDTELRRALVDQLDESRTGVLIAWAQRRLRLGSGAVAIPALEQSVRADGLRETVVALLIRCLYQAGRLSDALAVYHHARERLDSELGVLPGAALQAALAEALGGPDEEELPAASAASPPSVPAQADPAQAPAQADPAPPSQGAAAEATPARAAAQRPGRGGARQLPRQPAGFVGRGQESGWLDRECGPSRTGDGLALVVGPAGAGKSATVIRWAHSVAAGFPDGQLFVDLRGFDPVGPADPAEVLGQFLRALGEPEAGIPEDHAARATLYRSWTERRSLLVVLDNARSADHVRDLLPTGPDCATIVTSRNTLEDLVVTEGAALLRLEALPDDDALRLLERMLTPERVRGEEDAAGRLIELCDHLPLALRIAASRLTSRPGWTITDLVTELADERLRLIALDTQGAASIRTTLGLTYRHLSPSAASLITLLAAHPGREVDAFAAAALLGSDLPTARSALGDLAAYHLLTESTPGRYGRHDLIRLFSMELFAAQPAEVRRLSTDRLLDYYHAAVRHCCDHLNPDQDYYGERAHPPKVLPQPPNGRSALDWFRAEEAVIRALITRAAEVDHERAWQLAQLASGLYYGASRTTDWLSCLRIGLRAAERSGSRPAVATLRVTLANALLVVARFADAQQLARRALADTGPTDGSVHVRALSSLALTRLYLADLVEANELADRAVALARADGSGALLAYVLGYASAVAVWSGDAETTLSHAREVRALLADHPAATMRVYTMLNEAQALQLTGEFSRTQQVWSEALAACREAGFLHLHAIAEQLYARFLLDSGRAAEAAEHLRSAIGLYELHGYLADDVTELLLGVEKVLDLG